MLYSEKDIPNRCRQASSASDRSVFGAVSYACNTILSYLANYRIYTLPTTHAHPPSPTPPTRPTTTHHRQLETQNTLPRNTQPPNTPPTTILSPPTALALLASSHQRTKSQRTLQSHPHSLALGQHIRNQKLQGSKRTYPNVDCTLQNAEA